MRPIDVFPSVAQLKVRDRAILCGLFLSKFDQAAVQALDFASRVEAFNIMGHSVGVAPASIKNYRDEFDPVFPNERVGRTGRPMREHCRLLLERFGELEFNEMRALVVGVIDPSSVILGANTLLSLEAELAGESVVAKRIATGLAAEGYFRRHYKDISLFRGHSLIDTTLLGCGFDFRLDMPNQSGFLAAEVKGLRGSTGEISLTEKEYRVASRLREDYIVVVITNFSESPLPVVFRDPVGSPIGLRRRSRKLTEVRWEMQVR